MRKQLLKVGSASVLLVMFVVSASQAQDSPYFEAVTNLNPTGYWPMHEMEAAAPGDTETNYGSLGALGTGYYNDWNVNGGQPSNTVVIHDTGGVLANDLDTAVNFNTGNTSYMLVPHTSPTTTLAPPFTMECWFNGASVHTGDPYGDVLGQGGATLNGGGNDGPANGVRIFWAGQVPAIQIYVASSAGNVQLFQSSSDYALDAWHYAVLTCDTNDTFTLYVDGNYDNQKTYANYTPTTWNPLTVGAGFWRGNGPQRQFHGMVDEVAIYTNVLTTNDIDTHYNLGTNGASGAYFTAVINDHPVMYYRMDSPTYIAPPTNNWPALTNYGSVALNGVYTPGTLPGAVGGPTDGAGHFIGGLASNTNAMPGNGLSAFADAGYGPAFNPTGNTPLSVAAWFKGNPADARLQTLVGHSDSSWHIDLDANGKLHFNPGVGSDAVSTKVYNDGDWHQVVGVYDGSADYLYVDGILNTNISVTGVISGSTDDVLLGADPQYTGVGINAGTGQQFAGNLCEVAFWNGTALTAGQIQQIYSAAEIPPEIIQQPAAAATKLGGQTNVLSVTANGSVPLVYQWYFNATSNYAGASALANGTTASGSVVSGATAATLTITNLQDSDNGYYYVIVTNDYGSVTSAISALTVFTQPVITSQFPSNDFSLYANQNYTLSLTVKGATPLHYQWLTNGAADTTAGTNSTYALVGIQTPMSGTTFQCIITNAEGAATNKLVTLTVLPSPTAAYATNILNLNPVGYWPMQETTAPAPSDIETNFGFLGSVANAYYVDTQGSSPVNRGITGALAGDSDPAAGFTGQANCYLAAPATSTNLAQAPFTIEFWAWPSGTGFTMPVGKSAYEALNGGGNPGAGNGVPGGWTVDWSRTSGEWDMQMFGNGPGTGTANATYVYGTTAAASTTNWQHVVFTFDGTNITFYWNGQQITRQAVKYPYLPDIWNPLTIGAGRVADNAGGDPGGHRYTGYLDEVALYTNALSSDDVLAHYQAGTNPAPATSYQTLVMADHPMAYYRLDAPAYTAPPPATSPALINYGSSGVTGSYPPNTVPGGAPGPGYGGFGSANVASPINGLNAAADAGYAPALNPTNQQPLAAMIWVKGNPTDTRFQNPMGHSDQSWRFGWDNHGKVHWNAGAGGEITSVQVVNDGNWHFLAGVYDGTSNYLYIDGVLDSASAATATITGSTADVYLGGAPDYTASGNERYFAGSICEAAFFTNALTTAQIQQLYNSAGIPPQITQQPKPATASAGALYTNTVAVSGTTPLFYQWYQDNVAVDGQTNASLFYNPLQSGDQGSYYVVITNNYGSVTSTAVTLTVIQAPVITRDITSTTLTNHIILFAGAHPTFGITAVGALPLSYQWLTNGVKAGGATNAGYTLTPVPLNGLTNFAVMVTNTLGAVTSAVVTVTVTNDPTAPYPQSVLADDPLGYWRLNEGPDDGNGNQDVLCHDYVGADNGIYTNVELGQTGYKPASDPTVTSTLFGEYGSILPITDNYAGQISGVNFAAPTNASSDFTVEAWVNGFAAAQISGAGIVTKGYGNGGEQFDMDVYNNDLRFFVRDAGGGVHGVTSTFAVDSQWHHVVGVCDESDGVVSLYVDGQLQGTASIAPGSGILTSTNVMTIGARKSGISATNYDFQFTGYLNDVAIYYYALSAGQISAQYLSAGIAPSITQDLPANLNANENGTVTLTAEATGTSPLLYQWEDANQFEAVPGATNNTLVVSNLVYGSSYAYYLTVSNLYGGTNSSTVFISVIRGAPQIGSVALPPNIYVYSNSVYPYSVTAAGTEPFSYQWYNGTSPVAGATNGSYAFTAVTNTTITVVVTNVYGAVTSNPSKVTIITPPANTYAQTILTLGPVGYWPMQETNAPAPSDIETNLGTLGPLANAYYLDTPTNPVVSHGVTGALNSDGDPATGFNGQNNCYMAAPAISTNLALTPPFTIEFWAWPSDLSFGMPVAKNGFEGLNSGLPGAGTGNLCGWSVDWARNGDTRWDLQLYHNVAGQGNAIQIYGPTTAGTTAGWQYVVFTYDGTTVNFYWNGQFISSGTAPYVPDTWSPLCVGGGRLAQGTPGNQGYRLYNGLEDEVALYTNILSGNDILAHYEAGTNSSPATSYKQLVLNDHPSVYYRMDAPTYATPPATANPALINYGSASVTGSYPPNTVPGGAPGPDALGLGSSNVVASPINGLNAAVDAGYAPAFNPATGQPITAMVWVKGYPTDGRIQSPMSHGDQSWHFGWDSSGKVHWSSGNNGGEITSSQVVNDGNWHLLTGVYDGNENLLYIDGALDSTAPATGTISGNTSDVYLGGSPDYTGTANEEYFSGSICQAAFFTNALTAAQIQTVYEASSGAVPAVSIAPVNGQVVITWNVGTLLSSTNVTGPYNPVLGATSPYTNTPSAAQMFYRVSNP
jgi:Concanavalin A-like lectin/glucanases superfamily/Immunoglobulin I-set domain